MFMVKLLKENIEVEVMGIRQTTKLCFSEGMIGVLPVFAKHEDALIYAGREDLVVEIFEDKKNKRITH